MFTRLQPSLAPPRAPPGDGGGVPPPPPPPPPRRRARAAGARGRPPPRSLAVGWSELEAVFLSRLPPGTVEWGAAAASLKDDGEHVRLQVVAAPGGGGGGSGGGGGGAVVAGAVVVADGALSTVARAYAGDGAAAEFQVRRGRPPLANHKRLRTRWPPGRRRATALLTAGRRR